MITLDKVRGDQSQWLSNPEGTKFSKLWAWKNLDVSDKRHYKYKVDLLKKKKKKVYICGKQNFKTPLWDLFWNIYRFDQRSNSHCQSFKLRL